MPLEFHKRAKLIKSDVSTRRQWWSKVSAGARGQLVPPLEYVVERVDYASGSIPSQWRTLRITKYPACVIVKDKMKTKVAAIKAAERDAKL